MHTEKLLNLLLNLEISEDTKLVTEAIIALNGLIAGNEPEKIEEKKEEVYKLLDASPLNEMPFSDAVLLKKIGGNKFFAKTAREYLEGFFNTNAHLLKTNIEQYILERNKFIKNIETLTGQLKDLGFSAHYSEDEYEVGITLPDKFKNLEAVARALQDWNLFVSYLASIKSEDKDVKISLVSEGSLSIFVVVSTAVAKSINFFMGEVAVFYENVARISKAQLETKFLENQVIQEELKASILQEKQKFISKSTDLLLSGLELTPEEMNVHRAELSGRVKKVLTLTEKGVRLELVPPEPDEDDVEPKDKSEREKTMKEVRETRAMNAKITPIYLALPEKLELLEEPETIPLIEPVTEEPKGESSDLKNLGTDEKES